MKNNRFKCYDIKLCEYNDLYGNWWEDVPELDELSIKEDFINSFNLKYFNHEVLGTTPFEFISKIRLVLKSHVKLFNELVEQEITNGYMKPVGSNEKTTGRVVKISDTPQSNITSIDNGYLTQQNEEETNEKVVDKRAPSVYNISIARYDGLLLEMLKKFDVCFVSVYQL